MKNSSRLILSPIYRFINNESFSGVLLIAATAIALIWANSPFKDWYFQIWDKTYITFSFHDYSLSKPLYYWINDGLMTIFFFVIGLEIKRETVFGELSKPSKSMLPIMAAIGGMVIPALIYFLFTKGDATYTDGWAIPMATDIAFSLGILALIGRKVPFSLKIFLTALAIVDDLGAVLSIAIFYTDTIQLTYLIIAACTFVVMMMLNILGVRSLWFYGILAVFGLWLMLLLSGVHATIAGILTALTIPTNRRLDAGQFTSKLKVEANKFVKNINQNQSYLLSGKQMESIDKMKTYCQEVESPLQRVEHNLHNFSIYFIMPVFALANTGIILSGNMDIWGQPIAMGIIFGLVFGKTIGIFLFSLLALKLKIAKLPEGVNLKHIIGAGMLAGIGFTMSLFITELAFHEDELIRIAKFSILVASLFAGVIGYLFIKFIKNK